MAKKQAAAAAPPKHGRKARETAFRPTRAQRAFVAAAAGLGVPREMICRMLPGEHPGETVAIDGRALWNNFWRELRGGLKLAVALVEARMFQHALSGDDRSALTAQTLILNTRGGGKPAGDPAIHEPSEAELAVDQLNRRERDTLRKLLTKATVRSDTGQ